MQEKNHCKNYTHIHIDQHKIESPNPTTGSALYALAKLGTRKLFREVDGDHEDEFIKNNEDVIHLHENQHFYSQIKFTIIVNAQQKVFMNDFITYQEIIALAFIEPPTGDTVTFTISYRNGVQPTPEGTMIEDHAVKVQEGMIFNVTSTNKS